MPKNYLDGVPGGNCLPKIICTFIPIEDWGLFRIRVHNTDFVQNKLFMMARETACLNVSILQDEVAEKCGKGKGGGSGELWLRCWLLAVVDGCCSSLELVGFSPRKGSSQAARYPTIFGWFTWTTNHGLSFSP